MRLLRVEIRRDLARRLIRFLVAFAVGAIAVVGVLVFVGNEGHTTEEIERLERQEGRVATRCIERETELGTSDADARAFCEDLGGESEVAYLTDLWTGSDFESDGGGILSAGVIFLMMGGLFAGSTVIGAEWRHGTMQTELTWEPRRYRLLGTKFVAATVLAVVIGFVLEVVFVLSFVPTAVVKGSTAGADTAWYLGLGLAMGRGALLAAVAALFGATIASMARNSGAGIGVVLGWIAVVEPLVRAQWPDRQSYLLTSTLGAIIPWAELEVGEEVLTPGEASVVLGTYVVVLVIVALVLFGRRDIPAAAT